jgi:predicted metal-binding membrane protein
VSSTTPQLLQRERYLILGMLLVLAALAWGLLIWQAPMMNNQARGLTMGISAVLFIAIWALMMVAMMFPAAAPMILMFSAVYAGKRRQEQPYVPTWIFVSAYLLVWTLSGVLAYFLAKGYAGAFRMGIEHGIFCLGCCWLLFVILFPLGMMNIAVLAAVTVLIFAEKALPIGRHISQLAGVGLIVYGVLVMFLPAALPMGM